MTDKTTAITKTIKAPENKPTLKIFQKFYINFMIQRGLHITLILNLLYISIFNDYTLNVVQGDCLSPKGGTRNLFIAF